MEFQYEYAGKSYPVNIKREDDGYKIFIGENEHIVTSREIKPGFLLLSIDGRPAKISLATEGNQRHIFFNGAVYRFTRSEGRKRKKADDGIASPEITSPISGKVVKVNADPGSEVSGGQTLMTIEAMKMEYQIKAPYGGKVRAVNFREGDQVDIGVVLIIMEKQDTAEKQESD